MGSPRLRLLSFDFLASKPFDGAYAWFRSCTVLSASIMAQRDPIAKRPGKGRVVYGKQRHLAITCSRNSVESSTAQEDIQYARASEHS